MPAQSLDLGTQQFIVGRQQVFLTTGNLIVAEAAASASSTPKSEETRTLKTPQDGDCIHSIPSEGTGQESAASGLVFGCARGRFNRTKGMEWRGHDSLYMSLWFFMNAIFFPRRH